MYSLLTISGLSGALCLKFLLFIICFSSCQDVIAMQKMLDQSHVSLTSELASPPGTEIFEPIDISPAIIPQYPHHGGPPQPMYPIPTFPTTSEPNLTGRCHANFSAISDILDKTAFDCAGMMAKLVANVVCCPQVSSLLHILREQFSLDSNKLVLPTWYAKDCFSDLISTLISRRADVNLPELCSATPLNLTAGSCPVTDVTAFEKLVNTSKLLDACSMVDPLKECCRPICQPAIVEAALLISGTQMTIGGSKDVVGESNHIDGINDCKRVVYSYLSRKLPGDAAGSVFRILSSCKVNKVCPLEFKQPSEVIEACRNVAAPSPSCCSSVNAYIARLQKQMLITNKQAIICSTVFGSMLRRNGVMTNIYELCDVDLKDFSIQGSTYGLEEGCLLRSLPSDIIFDNKTGFSFTCDLTDNIAAPWPSSSSMTTVSLCAPEMSLPALPTPQTLENHGCRGCILETMVPIFSFFVLGSTFLLVY